MKAEHNIARLNRLLAMYVMKAGDLIALLNEGHKKPLEIGDVFTEEIEVAILKRIDRIFRKGLHYYLDPAAPDSSNDASIFFRKHSFETNLNIGARRIVNQFEELKISLSAIAKLSDLELKRMLPSENIHSDPQSVASRIRHLLDPPFHPVLKTYLKTLISGLAEKNVFVFEFVETWNKRETANIDGFHLQPNVIVLKRQQNSLRREIFTLVHELGHYLLSEEEVESLSLESTKERPANEIEHWCNAFAYHFLAGEYDKQIEEILEANEANRFSLDVVKAISTRTHLSKRALYTQLLIRKKITWENYARVIADFDREYKRKQDEDQRIREMEKEMGLKKMARAPQPILSPLLVSTIQTAFYEGVIGEYEACKALNLKPDKIQRYLQ